ncbi:MAG: hypothetical protein Q9164_000367 [Protoblastenia rupestris]
MDTVLHIQGSDDSPMTPLFLIHAVSGLALPYLGLGSLTDDNDQDDEGRAVYGISSPIYGSRNYRLPSSLDDAAQQYISLIQREVRPEGPYLLGGWSLGGMIALKMASILEAQGETVLHVIMIDAPNPENYPSFVNGAEHDKITAMTYNKVVSRINAPDLPVDEDSSSGSESPDDDDDLSLATMLPRIRKHIYNGVHMASTVNSKDFLPARCHTPVTLVKCSYLSRPSPTLRDVRKEFVQKSFRDERMGWQSAKFKQFRTVKFRAQHDSAFDTAHVAELTDILRGVLARVA